MRRAGFLAVLALALGSVAVPARPAPLVGQMEVSMTWSPGNPPVGANVVFTTTASDNDGAVRAVSICFGDGECDGMTDAPSSLELMSACVFGSNWGPRQWSHKYTRAGTFSVRVTVTTRGCPVIPEETRSYTAVVRVG